MREIEARLQAIEERLNMAAGLRCLWAEDDEKTRDVIARAFPKGVPVGMRVMVLRWARDAEDVARIKADRWLLASQ